MEFTQRWASPLGGVILASDGQALTGLWFDGQKRFAAALSGAREEKALPVFQETTRWLEIYFGGAAPDFTPKLAPRGTAFQRIVWDILLTIPFGHVVTYGEIASLAARRMGRPRMSAQAVGGAVGHNPISLIIPCHRVIGANGSLTGYAGGLDKKEYLLRMERTNVTISPLRFSRLTSYNDSYKETASAVREGVDICHESL